LEFFLKTIEEKKGVNIEKHFEKKLHIKIKNKWKKNRKKSPSGFKPITLCFFPRMGTPKLLHFP
jgi:hypothetical protein